jgi:small ligand-binding sensory domain FIST
MTTTPTRRTSAPMARVAVSGHLDTRTAATEVAHELHDALDGGSCDLVMVFASYHHRAALAGGAEILRKGLGPRVMLGCTAESVLGNERELEGFAGFAVMALTLSGVTLHPWQAAHGKPAIDWDSPQAVAELIGFDKDFRAAIMLADPFTTPISRVLPAIANCGGKDRPVPVVGGMASGASQPGNNIMLFNDQAFGAGVVGVSIGGPIAVDTVVSQGCRPIGDTFVVTKSNGNVIQELGGRKPLEALQEMANALTERDRELMAKGILCGMVINEYKDRFGRGDFLVRNILGIDQKSGTIAVGDMPRVGQTIQFHVRDAGTAAEDLQLLLDAQQLRDKPFAGLLFTCNGRGMKMFGEPNHDVGVIRSRLGDLPLAGFFAAGEIGPIGTQSFLHGHTAVLTLFRGM